jgi:cytidylate kinase
MLGILNLRSSIFNRFRDCQIQYANRKLKIADAKAAHCRDRWPVGRRKGTIARTLADTLHYRHIDTGAMYRAVAWKALHDGIPLDDESALAALATRSHIAVEGGRASIDSHDVTQQIRTPEMDKAASLVARMPRVREVLVARQRGLAEHGGIVMEGRDIGTVVFPNADVKIYLDASAEERARRRMNDPAHSGDKQVRQRLRRPLKRATAPIPRGPHRH